MMVGVAILGFQWLGLQLWVVVVSIKISLICLLALSFDRSTLDFLFFFFGVCYSGDWRWLFLAVVARDKAKTWS